MNTREFRKNNMYLSRTWLDLFARREEKKSHMGVLNTPTIDYFAPNAQQALKRRVIFTAQNAGRNLEEANKIQMIHAELEDIPLLPLFALA